MEREIYIYATGYTPSCGFSVAEYLKICERVRQGDIVIQSTKEK